MSKFSAESRQNNLPFVIDDHDVYLIVDQHIELTFYCARTQN